jgi:hypothetical protein
MIGSEIHDNYMDSYVVVSTDEEIFDWLEGEDYGYGNPYYYGVHGPVHPDSHLGARKTEIHQEYKQPTIGDIFNIKGEMK